MTVSLRAAIGWADAIIAANELGLHSNSELNTLVELLGLSGVKVDDAEHGTESVEDVFEPSPAAADAEWTISGAASAELEIPQDRRTIVEALPAQPVDPFIEVAAPLQAPPTTDPPVPYQPPIVETRMRAAISALVQRVRRSRRIDIDRAVTLVAEQRPLGSVPRLAERTTQRGAVVVADVGPSMTPYLADVERFIDEVEHVVGSPNVTITSWDGDAVELRDGTRQLPMPPETPILIVSTLGAVRSPGASSTETSKWLAFADLASSVGADVVALVPHRLPAWPDALTHAMRIVAWDDLSLAGRGRG